MSNKFTSIDLFAGCGGLSVGLHKAGFKIEAALEINSDASKTYKLNHRKTYVFEKDIRKVTVSELKEKLGGNPLHLLAGCPPCQGFSSVRRLNRPQAVEDDRNSLINEYLRLVIELMPYTVMMENVPALRDYELFHDMMIALDELGYHPTSKIVNVKDYGVPQSRKRLVMVGSLYGRIEIVEGKERKRTVRDAIGNLEPIDKTTDQAHKITVKHRPDIMERIRLTPKNGGSRKDLPDKYTLACHAKKNVGFNDVYGRLRWDDYSTTITGGCLNPSKGRFLHPEEDRVISPREAALLQSFPPDYKFPTDISKTSLALLIGNALPPNFSYIQSRNIRGHLEHYLGR